MVIFLCSLQTVSDWSQPGGWIHTGTEGFGLEGTLKPVVTWWFFRKPLGSEFKCPSLVLLSFFRWQLLPGGCLWKEPAGSTPRALTPASPAGEPWTAIASSHTVLVHIPVAPTRNGAAGKGFYLVTCLLLLLGLFSHLLVCSMQHSMAVVNDGVHKGL